MFRTNRGEALAQSLAVVLAHLMTATVCPSIALEEVGKFSLDEWEVSIPGRPSKAKGTSAEIGRACVGHGRDERFDLLRSVSNARKHGHDIDSHFDTMLTQPCDRAQSRLGRGCARLEATLLAWLRHAGTIAAVAGELDVHPQTVRYRLGRLRELFGAALDEPDARFELELVLRARTAWSSTSP